MTRPAPISGTQSLVGCRAAFIVAKNRPMLENELGRGCNSVTHPPNSSGAHKRAGPLALRMLSESAVAGVASPGGADGRGC